MLKRLALRFAVVSTVILLTVGLGELVLRGVLGFRIWSATLEKTEAEASPQSDADGAEHLAALARGLVEPLVTEGLADAAWIVASPPRVAARLVPQELEERMARFANVASCYAFNRKFLEAALESPAGLSRFLPAGQPDELLVFDSVDGTGHPVYRFPPNTTLPTKLTTNRYGMRGPDRPLRKPEGTIRIACIGASTTVCGHALPWSYPEFLEYWLNAWATKAGVAARFEVINAGREGIQSADIAAIYEQEVRPFDVDFTIYYEGSNQFHLDGEVVWEGDAKYASPPPGLLPELGGVGVQEEAGWLARAAKRSAIASLLAGTVAAGQVAQGEPDKPAQSIRWPEGQDPDQPNLDALGPDFLALPTILGDLDRLYRMTSEDDSQLLVASFVWLVGEDVQLDAQRDRNLFAYVQRRFWPVKDANIAQLAAFQNRVFEAWCKDRGAGFLDIAARMPRDPALFVDPIHNNDAGVRARAWCVFEAILPQVSAVISAGYLPRAARRTAEQHPNIGAPERYRLKK